jgi:hypothetical protein
MWQLMTIHKIINLRYLFTVIFGLIFFIGCQSIPATTTKETWTFFEAIVGTLIFVVLQVYLFSENLYLQLVDEGFSINYIFYQYIGLILAFGTVILMTNVYMLP